MMPVIGSLNYCYQQITHTLSGQGLHIYLNITSKRLTLEIKDFGNEKLEGRCNTREN